MYGAAEIGTITNLDHPIQKNNNLSEKFYQIVMLKFLMNTKKN